MRILRLVDEGTWALEFHPYVTVVSGLDEAQRDAVVDAFRRAARGDVGELRGLIEAHGVMLDLEPGALDLLELDGVDADVVVAGDDIPGGASSAIGRQLRAAERRLAELDAPQDDAQAAVEAAERAADEAHAALAEARQALDDAAAQADVPDEELERLGAELAEAEAAVEALADPVSRAAGALQQAERAVETARAEHDAIQSGDAGRLADRRQELEAQKLQLESSLDPDAAEALDRALADLAEASGAVNAALDAAAEAAAAATFAEVDAAVGASRDTTTEPELDDAVDSPDGEVVGDEAAGDVPDEESGTELDAEAIEARVAEIEGILALHQTVDPEPVHSALDIIRLSPSAGELVPSPEAIGLAHRLEEQHRQRDSTSDDDAGVPSAELETARARVEELRNTVTELDEAGGGSSTPDAVIAELEKAHNAVLEAREGLDVRFGKSRAQSRLDEALEHERALLQKLGFTSYTDFMTGGRAALAANAESAELRSMRAELREAEMDLRELERRVEAAGAHGDLVESIQRSEQMGRELLGVTDLEGQALVDALLSHRVASQEATPVQELERALEAVGLPVAGLGLEADDVEAMAADWLDEYHRAEDRKAALEVELVDLRARAGSLSADAGQPASDASSEPNVFALGASTSSEATEPGDVLVADREPDPRDPIVVEADDGPGDGPADDTSAADTAGADVDADPAVVAAREAARAATTSVGAAKDRVVAHETAQRELAEIDDELVSLAALADEAERVAARVEEALAAVDVAAAAYAEVEADHDAAEQTVARLRAEMGVRRQEANPTAAASAALEAAERDVEAADTALHAARERLEQTRERRDAAMVEVTALRQAVSELDQQGAPVEEIEWYLLARLAGQRHVSFAGSVPLVLDRALDGVEDTGLEHLLDRLERMAGAVQVVHLSDDERILAWAAAAGEDRVAVVRPQPTVAAPTSD